MYDYGKGKDGRGSIVVKISMRLGIVEVILLESYLSWDGLSR